MHNDLSCGGGGGSVLVANVVGEVKTVEGEKTQSKTRGKEVIDRSWRRHSGETRSRSNVRAGVLRGPPLVGL